MIIEWTSILNDNPLKRYSLMIRFWLLDFEGKDENDPLLQNLNLSEAALDQNQDLTLKFAFNVPEILKKNISDKQNTNKNNKERGASARKSNKKRKNKFDLFSVFSSKNLPSENIALSFDGKKLKRFERCLTMNFDHDALNGIKNKNGNYHYTKLRVMGSKLV